MTDPESEAPGVTAGSRRGPDGFVLVGFDGSREASGAIAVGARLLPGRAAQVVNVWAPPGPDPLLWRRVTRQAGTLDDLSALVEQECAAAAEQVAADGTALARAGGWEPEPVTHRAYGDAGSVLARLAEERRPAAVVVGSRGLSGSAAVLGSVSDLVVHHSSVPVLVVPPMLSRERADAAVGPVLIGHDGSAGAEASRTAASALWPGRDQLLVRVTARGVTDDTAGDAAETGVPGAPETVTRPAHGRGARAVAEALDAEAAARDAAVVVVGSRGRSGLRKLVLGSTATAVLHHVHRPVLVVPGAEA